MKIIGISGKIGTGKTTLANHMVDLLGDGWVRRSFADELKIECSEKFNIPLEWFYFDKNRTVTIEYYVDYTEKKMKILSIRGLLQWWGTDIRRKVDPEYWNKKMINWIVKNRDFYKGIIIDDVRFFSETGVLNHFKARFHDEIFTIRINPHENWICDSDVAGHVSETELDNFNGWNAIIRPGFGTLKEAAKDLVNYI